MVAKTMILFLLPQGELLVQLRLIWGTVCVACIVDVLLSRRSRGRAMRASRPVTTSSSLAPTCRIKKERARTHVACCRAVSAKFSAGRFRCRIGASAGAAIFDATGGYDAAFVAMLISAAIAPALTVMLRRPVRV
jgi:hypothetical protein